MKTLPTSPYFEDLAKAERLRKAQDMAKALELDEALSSLKVRASKAKTREQIAEVLCLVATECERVFRTRPPTDREVMEYGIWLFVEADNVESVDLLPWGLECAVNEQWLRRWQGFLEVTDRFKKRCSRKTTGDEAKTRSSNEHSKIALALALLAQHPDWTTVRIAKEVPCNRTYLEKNSNFRKARDAQKPEGRKGHRDLRTSDRQIEYRDNRHSEDD